MNKIHLLLLTGLTCSVYSPIANAMDKTPTAKDKYAKKIEKKQEEKLLNLFSIDNKDLEIIKLINNIDGKNTKLDPNYVLNKDKLIFHAVFSKFPLVVQDLLDKGADVNFSRMFGKNKMSLLDIACAFSSTTIIKMLIDSGKIANFKDAAKSAIKWILNPQMTALDKKYKITAIKLLIAKEPSLENEPHVKEYLSKVDSKIISKPVEISGSQTKTTLKKPLI